LEHTENIMSSFNKNVLAASLVAAGLAVSFNASAGGTTPLTVNAKILSVCKVTTAPGTLDFGTIDPSGAVNATASATFTMKCTNGTVSTAATDNSGLNFSAGSKRLKHSVTATAFLPYSVAYAGDTGFTGAGFGGAAGTTVTVNGTITPANYNLALATTGAAVYSDTVTITVNP
jgi:spore coat protein U-like protein